MRAPGPRTIRRRWYVVTGAALAAGILYVSSDQRAHAPGPGVDAGAAAASAAPRPAVERMARAQPPRPRLPASGITDTVSTPIARDQPAFDAGAAPPVVTAIRGYHASPADKRRVMIAALAGSGPSTEPWTREAGAIFESWRAALQGAAAGAATLGQPRCYGDGCAVEVTFASSASHEAARQQFRRLGTDVTSMGGRVQTPPEELADGQIVVTWMFLRPDEATR